MTQSFSPSPTRGVWLLLWKHLKNSLRTLFRHFFPRDKQSSYAGGHPMCVRCSVDPKNPCSRVPPRFHRRPSFLLGHPNHLDSWIPDTNDEKASKCCWMSPQCGHVGAPVEVPWGLWKEGLMGAGEDPQITALKAQATFYSKPETSSKFRRMSKVDMVPLRLPQESKTKTPDHDPAQAQTHSPVQSPGHAPTKAQTFSPAHPPEPTPAQTQTHTPIYPPEHAPPQAETDSLALGPEHNSAQVCGPEHTSAYTLDLAPSQGPAQCEGHTLTHTLTHAHLTYTHAQTLIPPPASAPVPPSASAPVPPPASAPVPPPASAPVPPPAPPPASVPVPPPTSAPALPPTSAPAPPPTSVPAPPPSSAPIPPPASAQAATSAPAPTPAPVPMSATTAVPALVMALPTTPVPSTPTSSILTSIPSTLSAFSQGLSTGHVVYDARRVKQNLFHVRAPQNSGYSIKDLGTLSRLQEGHGLVSSGTAEQTLKQSSEDSAKPFTGSILGYLELGNMEWKLSNDVKDESVQPKTFPYCSFHPYSSEKQNTDSQTPVYPKFLVYSKDATPYQPCFHVPTSTQNSMSTVPPPCTLSLPLISPRSFVVHQHSNHQKPSTLVQTPKFPPTSKSPQSVLSSQGPIPPQFSTTSQTQNQPQPPELHENLGLNQDHGLQKIPGPSEDTRVPRKPELTLNPNLHMNPGFTQDPGFHKSPGLAQNPGLHKCPVFTQDSGLHKSPGLVQNPGLHKSPGFTQDPGLHKSPGFTQDPGLHKSPGFTQDPGLHKSPGFTQDSGLHKSPGFTQDPGLHMSPGFTQDPGLHKSPGLAQDPGLHKSPGFTQDPYLCKNPSLSQDSDFHKDSVITQDSCSQSLSSTQEGSFFRSPYLTQPSGLHKITPFLQTSDIQRSSGFRHDSGVCRNLEQNFYRSQELSQKTGLHSIPHPSQDSGCYKSRGNAQDPGVSRSLGFTQDSEPQKSPCFVQDPGVKQNSGLTQESGPHKNPGFVQTPGLYKDSGDYNNPGLTQDSGVYKSQDLTQDSDLHKNLGLTHVTEVKRCDVPQDAKLHRSPEHCYNPNLHKYPGVIQHPGPQKGPALTQDSGFSKTQDFIKGSGLQEDSHFVPNPVLHKNPLGTDCVQVLGPLQTPKSFISQKIPQRHDAGQHVPGASVPPSQLSSPAKAQEVYNNRQTFSEVPVLIELQPPSRRAGSQDWVYRPVDTAPAASQNYRQMSMPPQTNWKPHCPGSGTRVGHVVFDARQRQLGAGRDKCEALSPRRIHREISNNSPEMAKAWGYQCVMRNLEKEGTNVHKE
ncbi:uncharacterized protein SPEM3 isoform X2 [Bos taurus]|uniref:uncharacterized protein SPEM3 isoform X2 n=1 Tax=Bos taurus TaxID=9913 RepID=UPI0028CB4A1D|nr:uncharacterized protein SPEM3 isoform X2 [Bos taurus]